MKSSKYIGVCKPQIKPGTNGWLQKQKEFPWLTNIIIKGKRLSARFADERQAAIQYDVWSIQAGREPKNILSKI